MNILALVGFTVLIGTLGGKYFQRYKIPQVVSYLVIGVLLGKSVLHVWTQETIDLFAPFVNLALGLIGFMIGAELKVDLFKKRGRSIYSILFGQGLTTFFVVFSVVTLLTQKVYLGLLFGAVATATDPATTADVIWENKARGPVTTALLAIVALDDALALMIYGFASVFARSLITKEKVSVLHSIEAPFLEIGAAVLLGILGGVILFKMIKFIKDRERLLPFSLGIIVLTVGIATFFKIDLILATMLIGVTLVNLAPVESKDIYETIKRFSPPFYILFFVLVGARLDVSLFLQGSVVVLALVFFLSRVGGKMGGAILGGFIGKAPAKVTRFLGLGLFAQGGVAIGMSVSIYQSLSHLGPEASQIGLMFINVVVATIFIVQVIAPFCVRMSLEKAGETGRDVTEQDIIDSYKVADLVENDIPVIREHASLDSVVEIVKGSESYHFCVVDQECRLLGLISIGDLRETFLGQEAELNSLVRAKDIAVPVIQFARRQQPLREAVEIFQRKQIDFLPVVEDDASMKLVGAMHYQAVMAHIQKEHLHRRGSI